MKTRNLLTNIAVLSALLVASCSKAPNQAADSSQITSSQTTNRVTSSTKPSEEEGVIPAGSVKLMGVELSQVLRLYGNYAKVQIDTSQLGTPIPPLFIHFEITNAVTHSEMVQLLDKMLYDQAGIVATHPDKTHVVFKHRP
jgi:hypothetical protein